MVDHSFFWLTWRMEGVVLIISLFFTAFSVASYFNRRFREFFERIRDNNSFLKAVTAEEKRRLSTLLIIIFSAGYLVSMLVTVWIFYIYDELTDFSYSSYFFWTLKVFMVFLGLFFLSTVVWGSFIMLIKHIRRRKSA